MTTSDAAPLRRQWIIISILLVFFIVLVVGIVMITRKDDSAVIVSTPTEARDPNVATVTEVKQDLSNIDAGLKQAANTQAAAKDALDDGDKQIKIGS